MVDVGALLQSGAVLFGTVLAAPLLTGDNKKHRFYGFSAMLIGNTFALALHVNLSLWIFSAASIFWALMSMRGIWLNRPSLDEKSAAVSQSPEAVHILPDAVPDLIPGE